MERQIVSSDAAVAVIRAMGLEEHSVRKLSVIYEYGEATLCDVVFQVLTSSDPTSVLVEQAKKYVLVEIPNV